MGLAVKVQQHRNNVNVIEIMRIRLVRCIFYLQGQFKRSNALQPKTELMSKPYKQLETTARAHVRAAASIQKSAFAFIATGEDQSRHYLLQWNANWGMFNLVGGKVDNRKGDANSFQRAIQREVAEELGLICPSEFLVGKEIVQLRMRQFSRREQIVKNYHFAIFEVAIFPDLPLNWEMPHYFARWLSTGRENVFVSKSEIENLCTISGKPISATTRHILQEMGELPT